jgi:hypothetical protein
MIKIAVDLKYPGGFGQCFGSAMVSMRIGFRLLMTKNKKINLNIFYQNMLFTYPRGSINDDQATGESFSPRKRISSTSKSEFFSLFSIFVANFALLDPDPADPCGTGSETLELGKKIMPTIMLMSKMVSAFFRI